MALRVGTSGDDTLYGTTADDVLDGGDGDDLLVDLLGGSDTLLGGAGRDTIRVDHPYGLSAISETIEIDAGAGEDTVSLVRFRRGDFFGQSHANVKLGAGNDVLFLDGEGGTTSVMGGDGRDLIRVGGSFLATLRLTDFARGANGDVFDMSEFLGNYLIGWDGSSNPFGKYLSFYDTTAEYYIRIDRDGPGGSSPPLNVFSINRGGSGRTGDFSFTAENFGGWDLSGNKPAGKEIVGTAGRDAVVGTFGDDSISGLGGDDTIDGSVGVDTISGGAGDDRLSGGLGDDRLFGDGGRDLLFGGSGRDLLNGGADDDHLSGGAGADALSGGRGVDTFVATRAELAGDQVMDLEFGERIVISDAVLSGFGFSLNDQNLVLNTGETLVLSGFDGRLVVSAAPEGGVALTAVMGTRLSNDYNGDGRSDVFWREAGGAFTNWLGRADGGLVNNDAAAYRAGVPVDWKMAGSGDFNGDGRSDILFRNTNGAVTNWLGQADGRLVNNDAAAYVPIDASWSVAAVDDFNGDGRDDVLFRHTDGRFTNWLGRSDGGLVNNDAKTLANVATDWRVAGSGDFNGDGRADILWRNVDGRITYWSGRSDGGFTNNDAAALRSVTTDWEIVGTGDFNGDGLSDLLWRNKNGALTDWFGRADGSFTNNDSAAFANVPTAWHVADTGDYNGDGRFDILWRNDNGSTTTWLGRSDGGFTNNDIHAFITVPNNWQIPNELPIV